MARDITKDEIEALYIFNNNLPVLKLDEGIGTFISEHHDTYSFSPKYDYLSFNWSRECKKVLSDIDSVLALFKVAHIGRSRKVTHKGREVMNNIQCNIEGYAYTLPMGLKQLLNTQNIIPIILVPNQISNLNNPEKEAFRRLQILNLKQMILNMNILSIIEDYYYDDYFLGNTADLLNIKPLGKLIDKPTS